MAVAAPPPQPPPPPQPEVDPPRVAIAVSSVIAVVVLAATDVLAIDVGALTCAVVLLGSGCVSVQDAYSCVDGRVMLAIVFVFGVSTAMDNDHTRVAGLIASSIVWVQLASSRQSA